MNNFAQVAKDYRMQPTVRLFHVSDPGTVDPSPRAKTKIPENPFQCVICGAAFPQLQRLTGHISKAHRHRDRGTAAYRCADCTSAFQTPAELHLHFMEQFDVSSLPPLKQKKRRKGRGRKIGRQNRPKRLERYVCGECGKTLTSQWGYKLHVFLHSGERPHQCIDCGKRFGLVAHLKSHVFTHHSNHERPSYRCARCGKEFRHPFSLKNHIRYHNSKDAFACPMCSKQLTSTWGLKEHIRRFHDKPVEAFASLDSLEDHMYLNSTIRPHKCTHCKEEFSLPASLSIHMKEHDVSSKSSVRVQKCRKMKSYVCGECRKTLTTLLGYKTHMFLHSGQRPHQCFECGKRFTLVSHLKSHIFARHSNREGQMYKCTVCEKEFSHPVSLKNHLLYHKNKDSFACPSCSKQLTSSWGLKEHIRRTHVVGSNGEKQTNPRSYTCGECGKILNSQQGYSTHVFLHTGKRPHACTVCDKTFALAGHLRKHLGVHRGRRPSSEPFCCHKCGKTVRTRYSLQCHLRTHVPGMTVVCPDCGRKFTSVAHMASHVDRMHHDDDGGGSENPKLDAVLPYVCGDCGRRYASCSTLKLHMRRHTDELLPCPVCNKGFPTNTHLRVHMRVHRLQTPTTPQQPRKYRTKP